MGHLVRIVAGEWERGGEGLWRFNTDITRPTPDIVVRENDTRSTVAEMVREQFKLNNIIQPPIAVLLTYDFPYDETERGEWTAPPIEIKNDRDLEVFMALRIDCVWLELYVTLGGGNVDRYRLQKAEEDVGEENEEDDLDPKTLSYRGLARRGYILASESVLKEICTAEEFEILRRSSKMLAREVADNGGTDREDNDSSGGTSPHLSAIPMPRALGGVISLSEVGTEDEPTGQLALESGKGGCGSVTIAVVGKGKGKVTECADHISNVGTATTGKDINYYVEEAQRVSLDIPTDTTDDIIQVSQSIATAKGKGVAETETVVHNLNAEFDGSSSDRAIMIGRGYPCEGKSDDAGSDMTNKDHLYVGQVFMDIDAFKMHMSLYVIANTFRYLVKRSEPSKMLLECSGSGCGWRVYAAKIGGSARFEIRTLLKDHSCTVNDRWGFRNHATSSVVGDIMRNWYGIRGGSGPRPGELREIMRVDHSIPITYWKAWKAKEAAIDQGAGNADKSYLTLPSYLEALANENPGTLVGLETVPGPDGGHRFKYLFLAFGASILGYTYMRKVVIIDGTHLKGKYAGCLLTASAQDGNFQVFPIAFGVVDSENDAAWNWFFKKLQDVIPDAEDLVFVSDRHNSIYSGIRRVYPMSQHCACLMHLLCNVQTIYKKKHLQYLITHAARAFRLEDFYTHFNEIKQIDIACADYLIRIGFEHCARAHFKGAGYNIMTSNLAESLNPALAEAREFPIVGLIEYIRSMVMRWFSTRRGSAMTNVGRLTPRVTAMVARNFTVSTGYDVRHIIHSEYEVRDDRGMFNRVDLAGKTCSCKEYDLIGIPCTHAVAAAVNNIMNVDSLAATEYSNAHWLLTYTGSVNPVRIPVIVDVLAGAAMKILPPATRRPSGRPCKTRIPSAGEFWRAGVQKRKRVCGRCGGPDHNRATCTAPI
ncbi:hypothetical protein Bca4012_009644 [Brassica carinata]